MEHLLAARAEPNIFNSAGVSPLLAAVEQSNEPVGRQQPLLRRVALT